MKPELLVFWRRLSIRSRMAGTAALAVALAVAAMAAVGYVAADRQAHRELDLGLVREANRIKRQIQSGTWSAAGPCAWLSAPACVQLVGSDGEVSAEGATERGALDTRDARAVAGGTKTAFFSTARLQDHPVRVYTAPVAQGRAVQVWVRSDGVERGVARVRTVLIEAGAAGVLLACLLGYLVARTSLAPLARLTAVAERIAATRDTRHRIAVTGHDEAARLTGSFNTMLMALHDSLTAQRRLVADASHELRTPLTSLRTNAELLARIAPDDVRRRERATTALGRQITELVDLVEDLAELARGDEGADEPADDLRLDAVVTQCVERARAHRPATVFTVETEPTLILGVRARLARATANLLDNAAKFSPDGSVVEVRLRDGELTVRDYGPGVDPDDLPHIFDRFYRAPAARARPGSGLGLSIVAQAAALHGARATAEPAEDGGTVMRLSFRTAGGREGPSSTS
ncbi:HAMP domain-containing histidine kinase [Streptomyces sp. NBC_00885]|uniref:sensor histidine kinase n=1 Tax=Streptomyces sp. NBC_00885 TaxID=2975857 RepID=UPI00386BC36E|nr:HAMP domain-containing histidine kinase [Streptomyces sp. NBC_00885]